jgi:RNA polymerase sigma-70 factor (ECF subfamily)
MGRVEGERVAAYEAALKRWPAVVLPFEEFCLHLDTLGWQDQLPPDASGLYLCRACMLGSEGAWLAIDREFQEPIRAAIRRVDTSAEFVDETLQLVRHRLLAGDSPKIGTYRGGGMLVAWLRVLARRIAIDEAKARGRHRQKAADLAVRLEAFVGHPKATAPEQVLLRNRYASMVSEALSTALKGLPVRERSVLRLHYVQQQSIDEIGRIYGVHRATAARWLAASRQQILEQVQGALASALGPLQAGELDSLIGAVQSDIEVSITSLLGLSDGAKGGSSTV